MLPKIAEYALRAVACMASYPAEALSADKLAEQTQTPRRYLHKVLQDLINAALVDSRSGPGGGYFLQVEPNRISILDVINAVAPLERIRHCPLGLPSHTTLCPLHRELDQAYAATEAAFSRVTVEELVQSTSEVLPLCNVSPKSLIKT